MIKSITPRDSAPQRTNAIDLAEHAIKSKDYATLAVAAKKIAALVPTQSFLIEPLLVVADHLGQGQAYAAAVAAARVAVFHVPLRSPLMQQAVVSILKHIDALAATDGAAAVDAARLAARFAPSGSLEEQALAKTRELENIRTDKAAAKAFVQHFRCG